MKKYIRQEDAMGCGIACVAYILSISYGEAVTLFTDKQKRWSRGFTSKDIVEAIKTFGSAYRSVYIGREEKPCIENGSIVYVPKCKYFPHGHYLVKIQNGYMDSFVNLHESNFDHTKARAGLRKTLPNKASMKIVPTKDTTV